MNVSDGTITSSLNLTFKHFNKIWIALVPFITATAFLDFVYFAIFFSNNSTNFPELDTKVLLIHSFKYLISLPLIMF